MAYQRTRYTIWLIVCLLSFIGFTGCTGAQVDLAFPLQSGNTWNYQGTVTYTLGKQEQSMSPTFQLVVRQLGEKNSLYDVSLLEENEELAKLQLTSSPKGLINPFTGEIWLPKTIKLGSKWTVTLGQDKLQFILRSQGSTTVPAGTFPTYFIDFREARKGRGSLWLDPEVGIILFNWTSRTPGGHSTTHLELSSYSSPGNN